MVHNMPHLQHELAQSNDRITVVTPYGPVMGGRTPNGVAVFLEIPYALPPKRFTDPEPLPSDHQYEEREYIKEMSYAVQPNSDGQAANVPREHLVGLGQPTENPLFLNIFIPPSFPTQQKFPVKVYFHEGFLQSGSPHALTGQAQYICAEMSEVWVNIGYRLSAFGFLASHRPNLSGNYGFKDQWLALQWIKANIESFGGDPDNIQIQGHSAGSYCDLSSHSIHQQLHRASCLPEGEYAPFQSAILQSNAMLSDPRTPEELQPQFDAFCKALELDPNSQDILDTLRDPVKVPWTKITKLIETEALGVEHGIFRACLSGDWIHTEPGPMERQRSGAFARGLWARGVRSIVVGEVKAEGHDYSVSHPLSSPSEVEPTLKRYFPDRFANKLIKGFERSKNGAEARVLLGDSLLPAGLVHIPIRLLHQDLFAAGFPVIRYRIEWVPEQVRPAGMIMSFMRG
ncbi:Alpha/Beta hydrolase protein [Amanita rubescens]|nr:Alpha/Beta hydrolase protein [Amanita rubescens]